MKEREAFLERELLDFARSYLAEAFPNPERTGCPPDYAVLELARQPLESDLLLTDHLTCCSPCFRAYMEHLGALKAESFREQRAHQATWILRSAAAVAAAVVLVVALYLFLPRRHHEPIQTMAPHTGATPGTTPQVPAAATYVPVVIDLSVAAQRRGAEPGGEHAATEVTPAHSLVDLILRLPVGSETGRYSIALISDGKKVWSGSAEAIREHGQIVLRTPADFTGIPAGDYDLRVTKPGIRLAVPFVLK